MKTLHRPERPKFTPAAKSAAFLRGLLAGKPLLEVAREGLSRDIDEPAQVMYAKRIRRADDPGTAFLAMAGGVESEAAERILAETITDFDMAFTLLINGAASSYGAQAVLARQCASPDSALQCFMLLKFQTVPSPEAQEILAHAVYEGGLSDRAVELLQHGSLASGNAQVAVSGIVPPDHKTIAKLLISGKITLEAAKELSKRMPPVISVIQPEP